jgi:hypothetical protein
MNVLKGVASGVSGAAGKLGLKSGRRDSNTVDDGNMEETILNDALPKSSLPVKSTPNKDSLTTRYLSVKSGELYKKNEQGAWHKIQAMIVPHWYLYYYRMENDEYGDTPKGVIDLHLYTKNRPEGHVADKRSATGLLNVVKLGTESLADGTAPKGAREFYFAAESEDIMQEWISVIQRDRYDTVKDERNAYLSLQEQFQGELEKINQSVERSEASKEELVRQIATAQTAHDDLQAAIQRILSLFGSTEEDMRRVQGDGRKSSELCTQHFKRMLKEQEGEKRALEAKFADERAAYAKKIEALEARLLEGEQELTAAHAREREEASRESDVVARMRLELHQVQVNLNSQSVARQEEADKAGKLSDEKKVLVKEVKSLRKRIGESDSKIEQVNGTVENMMTLNDQLTNSMRKLAQQKQTLLEKLDALERESVNNSASLYSAESPVKHGGDLPPQEAEEEEAEEGDAEDLWQTDAPQAQSSPGGNTVSTDGGGGEEEESDDGTWRSSMSGAAGGAGAITMNDEELIEAALRGALPAPATPGGTAGSDDKNGDKRGSFDLMKGLQELSWNNNSTLQQQPESGGSSKDGSPSPAAATSTRTLSLDMTLPDINMSELASKGASLASKMLTFDPHKQEQQGLHGSSIGAATATCGGAEDGGLLRLSEGEGEGGNAEDNDDGSDSTKTPSQSLQQFYTSPVDHDDDESAGNDGAGNLPMKVNCLRCGGTVEGPKHSTCKCKTPLIADLSSTNGQQVNEAAPESSARWDRRKEEARQQATIMGKRFSIGMSSMSESMSRAAAAASASISAAAANARDGASSTAGDPNRGSSDANTRSPAADSPVDTGTTSSVKDNGGQLGNDNSLMD